MVALAKQIVKDRCINCGAPIVGAVDEHYKCNYCRNMIMGVIKKM
jgi:DNA-directed RNA polymerase subunit RPC12/RpoP